MELLELMKQRHSVRSYINKPIEKEKIEVLENEIKKCNQRSGLHIQLIVQEKDAFSGIMAHYGKFEGVENYIALVGPKGKDLEEKVGYYGEYIVLKAQELGLNTCWVALTFNKRKSHHMVNEGEKLVCVIALGYGQTQGVSHKSKSIESIYEVKGHVPDWFMSGLEAALLAPTAMNQQKFKIYYDGEYVDAKATGGFYSKVDLGIVKYHFEMIGGQDHVKWK